MLTIFTHVGIPVIFTLIMSGMEALYEQEERIRFRIAKTGWDLCVLSLGLAGGVFANTSGGLALNQGSEDVLVVVCAVAMSLVMALIIAFLRRRPEHMTPMRAVVCCALGGFALGVPIYHIHSLGL